MNRTEHTNNTSIYHRLLAMLLIAVMTICTLSLAGCSKKEAEPQTDETEVTDETTEQADEGLDSLYGDSSLGIDAQVDKDLKDYRNILIGGIDNGNRTDIIMVLSINKETNQVKIFTVSRDTYMQIAHGQTVDVDGLQSEFSKCNRAYTYGDKYDLIKELNRHLDLNIREFIGVDWQCTADLVDALGGLEANIESESMRKAMNKDDVPGNTYGATDYKVEKVGVQTLNGWQAVQYLRVRKYKGGNARVRETRAREVAKALAAKAKSMPMSELEAIYGKIADELDTNMSRNTLTDTLALLAEAETETLSSWPFEYERLWEPEGLYYYLVPKTLPSNVTELHEQLFGQTAYIPTTTVMEIQTRMEDLAENYLVDSDPR